MSHFKHLFIFPSHHFIGKFHHRLEERTRYFTGPRSGLGGFRSLRMMSNEGEHEIIPCTVDEIEDGWNRLRGYVFDKVSVHEEVELTDRIHTFLQVCAARSTRVPYANHELRGISGGPAIFDEGKYLLREESVGANPHISQHLIDAVRYGLATKKDYQGWLYDSSV